MRNMDSNFYLNKIGKIPLLTQEEELNLTHKYSQTRNVEIAKEIVASNLRLVVQIAMELCGSREDLSDIIQEGNIGLIKAVEKYDNNRGAKFSTYATYWIRGYILKYMLDNCMPLNLSANERQRRLYCKLNKMRRESVNELKAEDMAKALEESESDIENLNSLSSLEIEPSFGEEQSFNVSDVAESDQLNEHVRELVAHFEGRLNTRDRSIFRSRWMCDKPIPRIQVGLEHGLSNTRVCQIEQDILSRLKKFIVSNANYLKESIS